MSDTMNQILNTEEKKDGNINLVQQDGKDPVTQTGATVIEPPKDNDNVPPVQQESVQADSKEQQTQQVQQVSEQAKQALQNQAPQGAEVQQQTQPGLSYTEMFQKLNPYKPPTAEEVEKERKRERREKLFSAIGDGVSALANLYFASQGAPNMYDPKTSMSGKVKDHWDKLRKEREDNAYKFSSAMLNAARLDEERKNGDRNYMLAVQRHEDSNNQWQQQFDEQKRHNEAGEQLAREKAQAENELAQKKFDEGVRQFNVSSQQQAQRIRQEGQRIQREIKKGQVTFALGEGKGTIDVSTDALNAANVGYIFSKLPEEVRSTVVGDAITDKLTGQVVGHKDPSTEAMLIAIGSNIQNCPEAQDAIRELAGQKPQGKKGGFTNGGQGKTGGFKK